VQRSVTVHGDETAARRRLTGLTERFAARSGGAPGGGGLDVAGLAARYVDAGHGWRPATVTGNRGLVAALARDPLGAVALTSLTPAVVVAAIRRWHAAGLGLATRRRRRWARLARRLARLADDPKACCADVAGIRR